MEKSMQSTTIRSYAVLPTFFLFGIESTKPTNAPYATLVIGELVIEQALLQPIK